MLTAVQSTWHQMSMDYSTISDRPPFRDGEGGGLNANYTQVDAVARISTICGQLGLRYGKDFIWESFGTTHVAFRLKDEKHATMLGLKL